MDKPAAYLAAYPRLLAIDCPVWQEALAQASVADHAAGTTVFFEGEPCTTFPLVSSGLLRLQRLAEDGHEITLGHLAPGQLCYLAGIAVLSAGRHEAEAITERDCRLVEIPATHFRQAFSASVDLRDLILKSFSHGMANMLTLIEEVAFGDMNDRLVTHLLSHEEAVLHKTHHDLATELGTAREVVSRLLKRLERRGLVQLGRGTIELSDRESLRRALRSARRK